MHIAIDGKPLTIPHPCGVKHYAFELLDALSRTDTSIYYTVFLPKKISTPIYKNIRFIVSEGIIPWQVRFPYALSKMQFDIVLNLHQHGSVLLFHKKIITIVHDLAPTTAYPSFIENPYYWLLGKYVPWVRSITLRKSSKLVAISEFTKKEILRFGYAEDSVIVIHSGLSDAFRKKQKERKRNFILALVDFSPRKNTKTVIQAYAELPIAYKKKYPLTLIISMPHVIPLLKKVLKNHGIETFTNIVISPSRSELIRIYDSTLLFCYLSLYEGFGLPILEAMARNCVVLTSNVSATGEIAGNAAVFVNPYNAQEVSEQMRVYVDNSQLRTQLVRKGNKREKQFTWGKTAKMLTKVFYETQKA